MMLTSVSSPEIWNPFREGQRTESLAVGGEDFVKEIREALGGAGPSAFDNRGG